jgi:anti-anti-sigma regulatory factor
MPDSKVRTTRPLDLTSEVVLRPIGPLDAECAAELRQAVEYVVDRPGGPIVVDCESVTVLSTDGAAALEWLGDQAWHGDRDITLRHDPAGSS